MPFWTVLGHGRPPFDAVLTTRRVRRRVPRPQRELHADHGCQSSAIMQSTAKCRADRQTTYIYTKRPHTHRGPLLGCTRVNKLVKLDESYAEMCIWLLCYAKEAAQVVDNYAQHIIQHYLMFCAGNFRVKIALLHNFDLKLMGIKKLRCSVTDSGISW